MSDPADPLRVFQIPRPGGFGGFQGIAYSDGNLAVAAQAEEKTDPGSILFYSASGERGH